MQIYIEKEQAGQKEKNVQFEQKKNNRKFNVEL